VRIVEGDALPRPAAPPSPREVPAPGCQPPCWLTPITADPDPVVVADHPAAWHPNNMGAGRHGPAASNPNPAPIPGIVSRRPDVIRPRSDHRHFVGRRGWRRSLGPRGGGWRARRWRRHIVAALNTTAERQRAHHGKYRPKSDPSLHNKSTAIRRAVVRVCSTPAGGHRRCAPVISDPPAS
jgi:hypothetical protein